MPHTPNRFIVNKYKDLINTINIKNRTYSPNIINPGENDTIINTKQNKNIINNKISNEEEINNYTFNKNLFENSKIKNSNRDDKDYDNILQNQLKDMEKHINLLNQGIDISDNKYNNSNYFSKTNNNYKYHFEKPENYNFFKDYINFNNKNDKKKNE